MPLSLVRLLAPSAALALVACADEPASVDHHTGALRDRADGHLEPAAARAACVFGEGARVRETLGLRERAALPIGHVIVVMKENRSFDHLLGLLHYDQPATERIPDGFANPALDGRPVRPWPAPTTCLDRDPGHTWDAMHAQVHGGLMDGFVTSAARTTKTDGRLALTVYAKGQLPFYYWLASTFALDDRHFASARTATFPNRNFLLLGTADGVIDSDAYPRATTPSIFDRLDDAGVSWGVYGDGLILSGTWPWDQATPGVSGFDDLLAGLDDGTLPEVVFVDGIEDVEDDHPPGDLQVGERWLRAIYQHAAASPLWSELAIIWTYDEAGGFFDHVPPPEDACVARPGVARDRRFTELGARVPLVVISPWARPHFASHVVEEHTAITRFIEAVFDLPALTARDANSTALLELFDFTAPRFAVAPEAPAAGTGGCAGE